MKQNAAAKNRHITELFSAEFPQTEVPRPLLQSIQCASENGERATINPPTTANIPRSKSRVTMTPGWTRSFPTKNAKPSAIKVHTAEIASYFVVLVLKSISWVWLIRTFMGKKGETGISWRGVYLLFFLTYGGYSNRLGEWTCIG